jgi:hypothetical protein
MVLYIADQCRYGQIAANRQKANVKTSILAALHTGSGNEIRIAVSQKHHTTS